MRKKRSIGFCLILLIAFISLGYAFLFTKLDFSGTAFLRRGSWEIYFEDVSVVEGSISTGVTTPQINLAEDSTEVSFSIASMQPGDYYEFTIKAVNNGNIDAMIGSADWMVNGSTSIPDYVTLLATYAESGNMLEVNDLLEANDFETYRLRVEYDPEVENLPSSDTSFPISFIVHYVPKTEAAQSLKPVDRFYGEGFFSDGQNLANNESYKTAELAMSRTGLPFVFKGTTSKGYLYHSEIGFYYGDGMKYFNDSGGISAYESKKVFLQTMLGADFEDQCFEGVDMEDATKQIICSLTDVGLMMAVNDAGTVVIYDPQQDKECLLAGEFEEENMGIKVYCGEDVLGFSD